MKASLPAHTTISHYRILRGIGAGGMGEVYLAEDTQLKRKVAIKLLPPESTADEQAKKRLVREARAAAKLDHQNICSIYEVAEEDGRSFIVMQYIEGETLASRIHRKPLRLSEAMEIATQTADALAKAHSRGIIHRDIKPQNIMISSRNQVKVMDFGLAKMIREEVVAESEVETQSLLTTPGVVVGTVPYMSPEQVRGEPLDARSDIFSFGVLMYEILSRQQPFAAKSAAGTISAILTREPPPLASYVDVPSELQRIVRKCLDKDRERRYQSTSDLSIDLHTLKRESETSAATPATPNRATESRSNIQRLALGSLVVGAIALTGVGAYLVLGGRTAPAWSTARTVATQLTNYGGTEASGALSPDGRSLVFVSEHGGTPDIWLRQIAGGEPMRLTNDAAEEADTIFAPDGETIYFTRSDNTGPAIWSVGVLGGQARRLISNARLPVPSPDGDSLAYFVGESDETGDPLVVSALDGGATREMARVFGVGLIIRPAWSPDGRQLSYIQRGLFAPSNLFIVEVDTSQARQVTHFARSGEGVESQAWLPDNRHLVVSYVPQRTFFQTDLGVLDIQDGSISRLTFNIAQGFTSLSVSADGTRVIATANQTRREVWKVPLGPDPEANGRTAVRVLDSSQDPMWTFVSRDGRTLLFNNAITGTRNLWTTPLDRSAPPRQITAVAGDNVMHSSLSPDGSRVVFASRATGNSDIWTQNVDGSDLRQLTSDEAADSWPVWSPDGTWIAFGSIRGGRSETWRVPAAGGTAEKVVDGFFRGDWIRQPTGTGTWLVSWIRSGGVRLIDFERQTVLWEKELNSNAFSMPMFSPDGRFISVPFQESRDRDAISLYEAATGKPRVAVRFPEPFKILFRACWVDEGKALVVNRNQTISHIVLFDRFWMKESDQY